MRRTRVSSSLVLLAAGVVLLCATAPARAADDQASTASPATTVGESPTGAPAPSLVASANRQVQLLVATSRPAQGWSPHVAGSTKTWIHRHPVLFGALVGAAGGAAIAAAAWGAEGAWVGTLGGGAAGALVAAIVVK